jgi:hypothetical protein
LGYGEIFSYQFLHAPVSHQDSFYCHLLFVVALSQTLLLLFLMKYFGNKVTLIAGLLFEMTQLFMIGFGQAHW